MPKRSFYDEFVTSLKAGRAFSLSENLPDPDPILRKSGKDLTVYNEIRNDSKVSACVEQRKASTLALQWDLLNAEEGGSEAALSVIKDALKFLDLPRIMSEMLEAAMWGFQPLEVLWEVRGGYVLPKDVIGKPPEWFVFDNARRLKFRSLAKPLGEDLPERKFLLVQHHPTYTNPYGQKTLPQCFWPVTFKKGGWKWWVTLAEKWGMPLLIAKYPRGLDKKGQDDLLDMVIALYSDAVGIMPNDTILETVAAGGEKADIHKALIDQCNAEIALAIVGQTLTTEIGSTGSYAAAKTHFDVRAEIAAYDKRMVERALQQLVAWIYEINWNQGRPPVISLWHEEDVDKLLAERDQILTGAGVRFTKSYFMRSYGLQEDDFEVKEDAPAFAAPSAAIPEAPLNAPLTGIERLENERKKLADNASEEDYMPSPESLQEQGTNLLQALLRLINEGGSYDEIKDALFDAYPEMDTKKLEEELARALYLSAIGGRLNG
jgi:phage gp29-like protein